MPNRRGVRYDRHTKYQPASAAERRRSVAFTTSSTWHPIRGLRTRSHERSVILIYTTKQTHKNGIGMLISHQIRIDCTYKYFIRAKRPIRPIRKWSQKRFSLSATQRQLKYHLLYLHTHKTINNSSHDSFYSFRGNRSHPHAVKKYIVWRRILGRRYILVRHCSVLKETK